MKQLKDRKFLIITLSLAIICIFTLTIAYSALSAVLTIQGNARVSAADWDIYLNNPRVTTGSATTEVPVIKTSNTLEFETTLNMPGDFYEFVVDVVNAGDIDAMIENVIKTPELTTEQAKFLKYEVSYQNGESITTKQLLAKDTTMPIKVRIEYRKDLSNTDLPTSQVVLDLALTLEYSQSDGTGNSVTNNGVDIFEIGNEICFEEECFYVINNNDNKATLFAKMNLNNTPKQASSSVSISGPLAADNYLFNYKLYLGTLGVEVLESRLISYDELVTLGCNAENKMCDDAPEWVYSTDYYISSSKTNLICRVNGLGRFWCDSNTGTIFGVRPVIVISKDYFN